MRPYLISLAIETAQQVWHHQGSWVGSGTRKGKDRKGSGLVWRLSSVTRPLSARGKPRTCSSNYQRLCKRGTRFK